VIMLFLLHIRHLGVKKQIIHSATASHSRLPRRETPPPDETGRISKDK
jgi:hypothetical protein